MKKKPNNVTERNFAELEQPQEVVIKPLVVDVSVVPSPSGSMTTRGKSQTATGQDPSSPFSRPSNLLQVKNFSGQKIR